MSLSEKYDRVADGFSDAEYADASRYNVRRADLALALGPPLPAGATVLDLGCGDGSLGEALLDRGFRYLGADVSASMCEAARRRLGGRARIDHASFDEYEPPEPVDATVILRALYLVDDRVAVLRRAAAYTRTKIVFDVAGGRKALRRARADALAAGLDGFEARPFLVPMRAVPRAVSLALDLLGRLGPLPLFVLGRRTRVFCAAFRA